MVHFALHYNNWIYISHFDLYLSSITLKDKNWHLF